MTVIQILPIMIVVLNSGLRYIYIAVAQKLHFDSETLRTNWIKQRIFFLLTLQLGLMICLSTLNLREFDSSLINTLFGGIYTDFNSDWFNDVGNLIVYAMLFNAVWPVIEFFLFGALRFV